MSDIHGPQYHPRSVTVEMRDGAWCVVDRSYGCEYVSRSTTLQAAEHAAKVRRATIKGALTRRANKAQRERIAERRVLAAKRQAALDEAGVTWEWLREDLTEAEADAWLGIDA